MRIPVEWIKDYVETLSSAERIGDTLTMLGIELEAIHPSPIGEVLEIKVTPNRGDCLSILGVARELCAKDCAEFAPTRLMLDALAGWPRGDESQPLGVATVRIESPKLCARYAARVFEGVPQHESSSTVQSRLSAAGMRPVSVIVDITNYVMLELGQPLHAFDLNKLVDREIVVRCANPGETIKTLDGQVRKLTPEMLTICDANTPVAIAGVMGGEDSEVSENTTSILLESAHFEPASVRKTRRALGMATEASYRFERYVDPEGTVRALNRFTHLLQAETGVACVEGVCDSFPSKRPQREVTVRPARWNVLLGTEVPTAAAAAILQSLGCRVSEANGHLRAAAPSWRSDLLREDDYVEEIGRVWGYEKIPEVLPAGTTKSAGLTTLERFTEQARHLMLRTGFCEVLNHTMGAAHPLDVRCERVELRNPGSPDSALLRSSVLPGIALSASHNRGRDIALFEIGNVFHGPHEFAMLGFLASGLQAERGWQGPKPPEVDFFFAKAIAEVVLSTFSVTGDLAPTKDERFHPNRQASYSQGDEQLLLFGQLRDEICGELDLRVGTIAGEVDLRALTKATKPELKFKRLSPFPYVRRDIAFAISKDVPYANIEVKVREALGETLELLRLFDVYEGQGVPEGHHSLAIALVFRHFERTLTDEECNALRERGVEAIKGLGGTIR